MLKHTMRQRWAIALLSSAVAGVAALSSAHADKQNSFGFFGGMHVFSDNNELGVHDMAEAPSLENTLDVGFRLGIGITDRISIEGEVDFQPSEVRGRDIGVLALGWRAHGQFDFLTEGRWRPFALLGFGGLTAFSDQSMTLDNDSDFVWHGGLGVEVPLNEQWGLRADGRVLLPPSSSSELVTTDFEILVGLYRTFGSSSTPAAAPMPETPARDDIADSRDRCRDLADGAEPQPGCPEPAQPADADTDGIADNRDACPREAEDLDGYQDADGCPEVDNDKDGFVDTGDACPQEAEDMDGYQDTDGCPEADNDNDGIEDTKDNCADAAEDLDGYQDADGCPDTDNDSDSIADAQDQCPDEPESQNGYQDEDGCPDDVPAAVASFTGTIPNIRFANGSTRILASSNQELNQIARVLSEYPHLRLQIGGHTDSSGNAAANTALSQRRADAIKAYLVAKGIAEARLVAIGFGSEQPLADNATPQGRAKNRRVEFTLLD